MADPGRYGIRVLHEGWVHECWATVNGGPDVVGSRQHMEGLAAKWAQEAYLSQVTFKVEPYTGDDAAERGEVLDLLARNGIDGGD